jgi:cytidylate kinase
MAVITFSREFGSEGIQISKMSSQSLHYLLVDKELIEKILDEYGMVYFEEFYDETHSYFNRFNSEFEGMVGMLNKTILAFAKRDNCIILSYGGFVILNEYRNVLNVCIRAPFQLRVSNVMKSMGISNYTKAENLVKENDKVREQFIKTYYNVKINETSNETINETNCFNLIIDTDKISKEVANRCIVEAAEALNKQEINREQSTHSIKIDSILEASVKDILI